MGFIHNLAMFLIGMVDSISLKWVKSLILCKDKQGKRHPASLTLQKTLINAVKYIIITMFLIPIVLDYFGIHFLATLLKLLYLGLNYGYIFFYNQNILSDTRVIILFRRQKLGERHFDLDKIQKIPHLQLLSGVIKGIIFLAFYYFPIMIVTTILSQIIPYLGMFTVIVSEAFFNAAFFFLSTWPYDKYNAAFLQKEKYYMLGFGMLLSILCNYYLSGFNSLSVCLIISFWMLINSVIYSPPEKPDGTQFKSLKEIWSVLVDSPTRNNLQNAYNRHRQKLVQMPNYGPHIVNSTFFVYPALKITEYLNVLIGNLLSQQSQTS